MATVVIAAYNEAGRVGRIVDVALAADVGTVLVVDDGSKDSTAEEAKRHGAKVLRLPKNSGKGSAMLAGVRATTADVIVFLDADLENLRAEHVRALTLPVEDGQYDMVIGMQDYGRPPTDDLPIISGQRAVRREFLNKLPDKAWRGYGIEVWLNDVVARHGGRTALFTLDRVVPVLKWEKEGVQAGLAKMADMGAEVFKAMHTIVEHYNGTGAEPSSIAPQEMRNAPEPATLHAKCTSTECVADALTESAAKAFGPFWTPEAQREVGRGIGSQMALPAWGLVGIGAYAVAGPLGLCVAGAVCVAQFVQPDNRVLKRDF